MGWIHRIVSAKGKVYEYPSSYYYFSKTNRTKKKWSEEELEMFKKMYTDQETRVTSIAKKFGISIASAYKKAELLGISRKKYETTVY